MMTCSKRNTNPLNVFEDVFGTLFNDSVGSLAKATQAGTWSPAVDIVESTDSYTLPAEQFPVKLDRIEMLFATSGNVPGPAWADVDKIPSIASYGQRVGSVTEVEDFQLGQHQRIGTIASQID